MIRNPVEAAIRVPRHAQWKEIRAGRKRGGKLSSWDRAFIYASGEPRRWLAYWFRTSVSSIRIAQEDNTLAKRVKAFYRDWGGTGGQRYAQFAPGDPAKYGVE